MANSEFAQEKIIEYAERAIKHNLKVMHNLNYKFKVYDAEDCMKEFQQKSAKKVFGFCHYLKKIIVINKNHLIHGDVDEILDTIFHEISHALAYELDGEAGHGKNWKKYCRILGCCDKAKGHGNANEVEMNASESKYALIFVNPYNASMECVGHANRKLKRIPCRYIPGRFEETHGNLYLIPSEIWFNGTEEEIMKNAFQ